MKVIRKEQVRALDDVVSRNFENEMLAHLTTTFAPRHAQVIGEQGMRSVIQLGRERCTAYGFSNRGPVRFYIELMFLFGSYFDSDPLLPWAGVILKNPALPDQMDRADRLHSHMLGYLERVCGPDDDYLMNAMRRIDQARPEEYRASQAGFEKEALRGLRDMHPEKCVEVGEPALLDLIERGKAKARTYKANDDLGVALFIALMFAVGHGFDNDPLFPWISRVLRDERVSNPEKRVERLYSRTKTYLGEALAFFERN